MKCKICKTNLPNNTAVCYKCGYRFIIGNRQTSNFSSQTRPNVNPQSTFTHYPSASIATNTPPPYNESDNNHYSCINSAYSPQQCQPHQNFTNQRDNWKNVDDNSHYRFVIGFLIGIIIALTLILSLFIVKSNS